MLFFAFHPNSFENTDPLHACRRNNWVSLLVVETRWKGEQRKIGGCYTECFSKRCCWPKVLGAISLADTILTALPAPEFSFRLSRNGRFRDFRADTASNLATWLKHLNEEIAARSSGGGVAPADKTTSAAVVPKLTMSRREGLEASAQLPAQPERNGTVAQHDEKMRQLDEKNKQLEAEVLILKQKVKELEARNAQLEAGSRSGDSGRAGGSSAGAGGEDEPEDAKAAELLKVSGLCVCEGCVCASVLTAPAEQKMNLGGDAGMRDQVEDLTFQLKAAQKRLKQAAATIKTQAQRIQLLEGKD